MIHNKVKRAARKLKKDLHGCVNLVTVMEYLKGLGYAVIFFNTEEGDDYLKHYELEEYSKGKRALTYTQKNRLVFVDNELLLNEKLYSLIHELGHIVLNHVGNPKNRHMDKRLLEAEAEAFLYEVITHNNILCIP